MITNIFTYGTLMFRPVWLQASDKVHKSIDAKIYGFERKSVQGEVYPVLIPGDKNDLVDGVVFFDISEHTRLKLDAFEGPQYELQEIEAVTQDNKIVKAHAYILKKEFYHIISQNYWDPQRFEKEHLENFLKTVFW